MDMIHLLLVIALDLLRRTRSAISAALRGRCGKLRIRGRRALFASTLGRVRGLAPTLRLAIVYPPRSRFRTGVTLAMSTLVVFTLVTGATIAGAFVHAFDNTSSFGGGFDVRATSSPSTPIGDTRTRSRERRGYVWATPGSSPACRRCREGSGSRAAVGPG
jgi:hypothetical protein